MNNYILAFTGLEPYESVEALFWTAGESFEVSRYGTASPISIVKLTPKEEFMDDQTTLEKVATELHRSLNRWFGKFEVRTSL